jgi:hypothetical protein
MVFMMRLITLLIAIPFSLTACQTTENFGSGPISDMSESTVQEYQNYIITMEDYPFHNFAFVYDSETQQWGWAGKHQQHGEGYAIEKAMENCRSNRPEADCKTLDIDGRIVWVGIDANVYSKLKQEPPKIVDTQTHEYDVQAYRISASQLKEYWSYETPREDSDFSAFFISSDGKSVGTGFSHGRSTSAHSSTIRNARRNCQIASPQSKCYLFTANGEPINEDARRALEQDS